MTFPAPLLLWYCCYWPRHSHPFRGSVCLPVGIPPPLRRLCKKPPRLMSRSRATIHHKTDWSKKNKTRRKQNRSLSPFLIYLLKEYAAIVFTFWQCFGFVFRNFAASGSGPRILFIKIIIWKFFGSKPLYIFLNPSSVFRLFKHEHEFSKFLPFWEKILACLDPDS